MTTLMRYDDGEAIREATEAEAMRSLIASITDGGAGAISVDGVTCYVPDGPEILGFDLLIDNNTHPIYRDVTTTHPAEVHQVFGTASESELQEALDGLNYSDWFRDGEYLGRDDSGLGLRIG